MHSCEATGKNIEQAIQNALLELKAAREDVDIKILSEGGFLKKAKVLVSISEDAKEKYEKKEEFKKTIAKEENDEDFAEKFIKQKVEIAKEKEKDEPKVKIVADEEISEHEKSEKKHSENTKKMEAEDFINGVLESMGLSGKIEKTEDDKFVTYNVTG